MVNEQNIPAAVAELKKHFTALFAAAGSKRECRIAVDALHHIGTSEEHTYRFSLVIPRVIYDAPGGLAPFKAGFREAMAPFKFDTASTYFRRG